jgi:deferrochelatase/peroxidase EfeB
LQEAKFEGRIEKLKSGKYYNANRKWQINATQKQSRQKEKQKLKIGREKEKEREGEKGHNQRKDSISHSLF